MREIYCSNKWQYSCRHYDLSTVLYSDEKDILFIKNLQENPSKISIVQPGTF